VASGMAEKCEIQLAYAIGVAEPVSLYINTFDTGKVPEEKLEEAVTKIFDLTPAGIIKTLDLIQPIYRNTCNYGHFGRDEFSWEKTDKVDALLKILG
jgi:S-adenosylmethionine synthetase